MRKLPFNKMHDESSRVVLHEEFLELCAISTSDELTEAERQRLETHLSECPGCREAMRQFDAIAEEAIPVLASVYLQEDEAVLDDSWSQDGALANLLGRLAREEPSAEAEQKRQHSSSGEMLSLASSDAWRHVWTLSAAGILLFVALGILAYRVGLLRGASIANIATRTEESIPGVIAQRLSDAEREHEVTRTQLKERDDLITDLRSEIQRQSDEMGYLKLEQRRLDGDIRNAGEGRQTLLQERSELVQKSEVAQAQMQELQERLAAAEKRASEDIVRATASQTQVQDLTQLLEARNKKIDEQEQLLAHDRDIRELMGARDLYIAEVYDVERSGETRKAFGRVFYTKGKSLVFYAYDLDQQIATKNASTFQAWGIHGTDRQQAVSLGIFYEDNASKRRWVLKTSDPTLLEQMDALFVTVEPNGGSRKPGTKRVLFAYLGVGANHP